jgi:putative proteasome-type protease
MTYGVAMMLGAGMIFASDSRTNAGVDHVASFRKMRLFVAEGNRVIVVLSSGNLSMTQGALNLLEAGMTTESGHTIWNINSMFQGAQLLGEALRQVRERDASYLMQANVESFASFLIGGQIQGERQRLFHIYSEGNFIEATPETPYFQIGEIKYGKPIIDRVITPSVSLNDAAQCVLVSFDSTMRSNLSVGMPIDLICYERDSLAVRMRRRFEEGDAYFSALSKQWTEGTRQTFSRLPKLDW